MTQLLPAGFQPAGYVRCEAHQDATSVAVPRRHCRIGAPGGRRVEDGEGQGRTCRAHESKTRTLMKELRMPFLESYGLVRV
jgi:hypothetical protein